MEMSRRRLLGVGAITTALAVGQGVRPSRSVAQGQQINLYSSRHYNTDNELYKGFTRRTGIRVNLIEGKADALIERIKAEGRNSPADVFLTVDAGRLWKATEARIFAPFNSRVLQEQIPAHLRDPDNRWFGFSKRARVIMYNRNLVAADQLSSYEDLANAKWRRKIAIRSSTNVYNQSLVASLIAVHGIAETESWCRGLVTNFARAPRGNDRAQIEAAASGLANLAIANHYYLPRYAKSDDPAKQSVFKTIKVFFPNQGDRGTHVNISGGGLVKTAPNADGAREFLEYLASSSAQVFFAQGNDEYPVVAGTALDPIVGDFGTFKEDQTVHVGTYGENQAEAVRLMDRAGWV